MTPVNVRANINLGTDTLYEYVQSGKGANSERHCWAKEVPSVTSACQLWLLGAPENSLKLRASNRQFSDRIGEDSATPK
jgi:hypothetical protein